jgi:hypothetical protein
MRVRSAAERTQSHDHLARQEIFDAPQLSQLVDTDARFTDACLAVLQDYRESKCSKGEAMGRLLTLVNNERGQPLRASHRLTPIIRLAQ